MLKFIIIVAAIVVALYGMISVFIASGGADLMPDKSKKILFTIVVTSIVTCALMIFTVIIIACIREL